MSTSNAPRSLPYPLGVRLLDDGAHVAVMAAHADGVEFCLLDPLPTGGWRERRVPLRHRTHDVWHDVIPGVEAGNRYGLRVHGPWDPGRGLQHNPAKLLTDPYARAVAFADPHQPRASAPRVRLAPELFGYEVDDDLSGDPAQRDNRDSLDYAVHSIITPTGPAVFDARRPPKPLVPWTDTVIYELHVRGFTASMPGVPAEQRGTYAGLASPASLEYLKQLGVTSVELLPVHAIGDEAHLVRTNRHNYWGYNTAAFFAPHPSYAATSEPTEVPNEFRAMVDAFHTEGLEVILDVVYNHTCEAGIDGPMMSWKGIDATTYYRISARGEFADTTGCGNSLDFSSPRVIQMTLDSLRHWVTDLGVDGFRFDLATTLARGAGGGYEADHPFLVALATDPVLADVKLIMEPWDVGEGGWRTGQFPLPASEWNDQYRDDIRDFWVLGPARLAADEATGGVRNLATRLAGSADVFAPIRGPLASINFITAHDGFTLRDLVTYNVKHNESNGENNRDGSDFNRSYNFGVEGETDDISIVGERRQTLRNLLGTLVLSTGVPMLVAGDEFGRTQHGNNNAYSTDDETTWIDWDLQAWQQDLLATTRHLLALRHTNPAVGQANFFAGRPNHDDGSKDLAWFGADGEELDHNAWFDPYHRVLQMYLHAVVKDGHHGFVDASVLVVFQGERNPVPVTLASPEPAEVYHLVWDSAWHRPPATDGDPRLRQYPPGAVVQHAASSMQVYLVPHRSH